jgi:hypothetical protein
MTAPPNEYETVKYYMVNYLKLYSFVPPIKVVILISFIGKSIKNISK